MENTVDIEKKGQKMTINAGMVEFMRRRGWTVVKDKKAEAPKPLKPAKKAEEPKGFFEKDGEEKSEEL
ncbi:MAG: hypothetical protein J6V90_07970 [Treponema sp.]|nr:hypothetical protein [Treponema sp.]